MNIKKLINLVILFLRVLGVHNFFILTRVYPVYNFRAFLFLIAGICLIITAILRINGKTHIFSIKNKIIRRVFALLAGLLALSFVLIQGLIIFYAQEDDNIEEADCMIILGAGLIGDYIPLTLQYRLDKGIEYLNKNPDLKVIVTGGQGPGETVTEAFAMEKYLINNGVDASRIIKEDKATSTFENFKFSKEILDEINGEEAHKIIVVTNNFHMFRSKMIAERVGFTVYRLPTKTNTRVLISCHVREYFAVIKSFIFDK